MMQPGAAFRIVVAIILLVNSTVATVTSANRQRNFFLPSSRLGEGTARDVQLSHAGLYLSSSPISKGAPKFLTLFLKAPLYDVSSVNATAHGIKRRNWDAVHLTCGGLERGGGIEACEEDDIKLANRTLAKDGTEKCSPYKIVASQWKLLFNEESCPSIATLLDEISEKGIKETSLLSTTLTFEVQRTFPARIEKRHFWIGKVQKNSVGLDGSYGMAKWPFAGSAHGGLDSTTVQWDGNTPNRLAGLMQDPYIPKASKTTLNDPLNGVDIGALAWSFGISIEVPSNSNSTNSNRPALEPVHAPVSGQIVLLRPYQIPQMPANGRNDERGWGVMIRDEWGFVYQLLGIDVDSLRYKEGDNVRQGDVLAGISRKPLSLEPPCRHRPADPPKKDDDSRRYPFRRHLLRVMVARPGREWTDWKPFYETGWQYYNPLDAFTTGNHSSKVEPDVNPKTLFFARPSEDNGLTPPAIIATTKDFRPVTLSGEVEIIVGVDSFQATPKDPNDSMDPVAIHALEWAAWPRVGGITSGLNTLSRSDTETCDKPVEIEWRPAFEHSKLPHHWSTPLPKNSILAHYVPSFTVGSVPFFRQSYASEFDEKGRKLFYAPTRNMLGTPDGRGCWDTTKEPEGNGVYEVKVRARDWWGNVGCFASVVNIKN